MTFFLTSAGWWCNQNTRPMASLSVTRIRIRLKNQNQPSGILTIAIPRKMALTHFCGQLLPLLLLLLATLVKTEAELYPASDLEERQFV